MTKNTKDEQSEEIIDNEDIQEEIIEDTPEETADNSCCEITLDEAVMKKLEELNDRYLRLYADFDNYKKRASKEKMDASIYAKSELIANLLNVVDNFSRALDVQTEDTSFYEGMKMISKQLDEILTSDGLEEIKAVGEKFDPNYHNAVMTDNDENYDDDIITEELQRGYMYKEKVIRPSIVKVNKR